MYVFIMGVKKSTSNNVWSNNVMKVAFGKSQEDQLVNEQDQGSEGVYSISEDINEGNEEARNTC